MTTPFKILCVDDDSDFFNYLLGVTESYNIAIDNCPDLTSTSDKNLEEYDAFILDLHLGDGSGLDLIPDIRGVNTNPIAIITAVHQNASDYRRLKAEHTVDFVLEKPVYRDQVDSLFKCLLNPAARLKEEPFEIKELREKYNQTIPEKLEQLTHLIEKIKEDPSKGNLEALKNLVHKIAGSAGSYGYMDVTTACRKLEYVLIDKLESTEIDPHQIELLDAFLKRIKYSFQFPSETKKPKVNARNKIKRNSVYIVTSKQSLIDRFEKLKSKYPITLHVDTDPSVAKQRLRNPDFNPRVVLVAETFPSYKLTGYDLLDEIQKKSSNMKVNFGLFLDKDTLDERIKAVKKGVDYLYVSPTNPDMILEAITEDLRFYLKDAKVLVLDDNLDDCLFIKTALEDMGIYVRTLDKSAQIYDVLEEFSPNVLLLDIYLGVQDHDGLTLLKTLRSDFRFRDLRIVIITAYENLTLENIALTHNVNDIFYKPLEKVNLQKKVSRLIRQTQNAEQMRKQDGSIDFDRSNPLYVELSEALIYNELSTNLWFVLIEVNRLPDLALMFEKSIINVMFSSLNHCLSDIETKHLSFSQLGENKFSLFFKKHSLKGVKQTIIDTLTPFKSKMDVTFNCAIVPVSAPFDSSREIIELAENTLAEVRKEESAKVRLLVYDTGIEHKTQDVILIDPDEVVLKSLEKAFESVGNIRVHTYKKGSQALEAILNNQVADPALIICERKLEDMDGLEFLKKLKVEKEDSIPVFFLTYYSSDKDVHKGLKEGALEYYTKPFNINNLMLKALRVIK
ncbi:MAG: response regulator [Waddliaceae bacterium]